MSGLRSWLAWLLVAILNWRGPRKSPDACAPNEHTFFIGITRPFDPQGMPEGLEVWEQLTKETVHVGVFGFSGSGKSTAIYRFTDTCAEVGLNCVALDFRGDSYDRTLRRFVAAGIPAERLTLMDFRITDRVTPFNILGYGQGTVHMRAAVVYEAIKARAENWGTRLGPDLRASLICLATVGGSLLDVSKVLSPAGADFREWLMTEVTDPYAAEFLATYQAQPVDAQLAREGSAGNKLDELLSDPLLRTALGANGAPDFSQMVNEPGHLVLVALAADRRPSAALIGRMIVAAVQGAAMSRVDVPQSARNPAVLVVDEAQNLLTEDSCQILAEARKYRLGLVAITQFPG